VEAKPLEAEEVRRFKEALVQKKIAPRSPTTPI